MIQKDGCVLWWRITRCTWFVEMKWGGTKSSWLWLQGNSIIYSEKMVHSDEKQTYLPHRNMSHAQGHVFAPQRCLLLRYVSKCNFIFKNILSKKLFPYIYIFISKNQLQQYWKPEKNAPHFQGVNANVVKCSVVGGFHGRGTCSCYNNFFNECDIFNK